MNKEKIGFGEWLSKNAPRDIRKQKHKVLIDFVFKLYENEIKNLGIKDYKKNILRALYNNNIPVKFIEIKKINPNQETKFSAKKKSKLIKRISKKKKVDLNDFYLSDAWLSLKNKVHKLYKCGCMKCGIEGVETHVDHILPRSKYPMFQLDIHNLQILCKKCNLEKSNTNCIDYRTPEQRKKCSTRYI